MGRVSNRPRGGGTDWPRRSDCRGEESPLRSLRPWVSRFRPVAAPYRKSPPTDQGVAWRPTRGRLDGRPISDGQPIGTPLLLAASRRSACVVRRAILPERPLPPFLCHNRRPVALRDSCDQGTPWARLQRRAARCRSLPAGEGARRTAIPSVSIALPRRPVALSAPASGQCLATG